MRAGNAAGVRGVTESGGRQRPPWSMQGPASRVGNMPGCRAIARVEGI